jgi:hypothetical protein
MRIVCRPGLLGPAIATPALALALSLSCGGSGPTPPTSTAPVVSSVTPSTGPTTGGTSVRITGSNFGSGATVTLGGAAATDVVVESSNAITAKTPPRTTAGTAEVSVTVGSRTGTLFGAFTYTAPASAAPAISALGVRGTRANEPSEFADVGEEVTVTAVVQDPDTAADQLAFEWTADAGTFSGTGASVKWRAPAQASTPATVKITVTVSDVPGQRVSRTVDVRLHDSVKEVGELARQFLLDFSDSTIAPAVVMRNFSTTGRCVETYQSELFDVERNRREYLITSSSIGSPNVSVQFGSRPCSYFPVNGDACAVVSASWVSTCLPAHPTCASGATERVSGTDYVTAVYEQSRWKLCASFYEVRGALGTRFIR